MSIPAMLFKSSTDICGEVPMPADAKLSWPGRCLAYAISSATDFTGSEGCTTSTFASDAACVIGAKSRSGSYGTFLYMTGLIASVLAAIRIVCPSAWDLAAISIPIIWPAPGRLSTTNCCPSDSESFCASARAMMSVPPPAAEGTMKRTGFAGYAVCAAADSQASAEIRRRIVLIAFMLSLQLELSRLYDFFPLLDLGGHVASHLLRAARARRATPFGEALRDFGERKDAPHLAVDPLDDRARHARRAGDAEKGARLVARNALRDGRHVRKRRRAHERAHGQGSELAALDVRVRVGERVDKQLHAAREHLGQGLGAAAKRHVLHVDSRHGNEQLAGEVVERPQAGGRIIHFPGIAFHEGDEFLQGPETRIGAHREHQRIRHQGRDEGKIQNRIVGKLS